MAMWYNGHVPFNTQLFSRLFLFCGENLNPIIRIENKQNATEWEKKEMRKNQQEQQQWQQQQKFTSNSIEIRNYERANETDLKLSISETLTDYFQER